jgi:hypothetical protein
MDENLPPPRSGSRHGGAQLHVVGRALHHEDHPELPFQALQSLGSARLDDVLAGSGPTEMQLPGQSDDIVQLPKLHVPHPSSGLPWSTPLRPVSRFVRGTVQDPLP